MSAELYPNVYLISTLVLSIIVAVGISGKSYEQINSLWKQSGNYILLFLIVVLAIWIGNRPLFSGMGDTENYALQYGFTARDRVINLDLVQDSGDWGFSVFMNLCRPYLDVRGFFSLVAMIYFGCTALAMKKFSHGNTMFCFLMFLGAFSTFSYATNGIRNGMACAILTLAIVCAATESTKQNFIIAAILAYIAMSIHKSTLLPIIACAVSLYVKNEKLIYCFWLFSILICLTFGSVVGNFLVSLGFDERMSSYFDATADYAQHYKAGFRPDFLLYSAMPLLLGYYIIFKRGIIDRTYRILLNTYILSNSVWVMIMNISFSNRFAYLSWFLYPIVLVYPCLKLNIWENRQGKMAAKILMYNVMFTVFMNFIYPYL